MPHQRHRSSDVKLREPATNHSSKTRNVSPSPLPDQKKKSKHKHKKTKKSKSKSRDHGSSSRRASGHSYDSEPESSAESTTSTTKHIPKKKHKRAKEGKKSRWQPLPLDIIEDYKHDNDPFRPLTEFVGDRLKLAKEVLKSVNMATVNEILPEFKDSRDEEREKVIYEMLKFMSRKRIIAILKCQDLSDSSTTNTDEDISSVEEKDLNTELCAIPLDNMTTKMRTKEKRMKKPREKAVIEDPEELEDGEIRSVSEESSAKDTPVEAHSTCPEKPSSCHSNIQKEIEMPNLQAVSPLSSSRSISSEREIADSTGAYNQNQIKTQKEVETEDLKQSTDSRQSLPQQVAAISTTTTGIEDTDDENSDSEEYPEYPEFELE